MSTATGAAQQASPFPASTPFRTAKTAITRAAAESAHAQPAGANRHGFAKQQAEELSNRFQGLCAEAMATGSQGLKQGMEKPQTSVTRVITQLAQLIVQARGMKGSPSADGAGPGCTHTQPPAALRMLLRPT